MRRTIRLKENELRHMIAESVRRVLNEDVDFMNADEFYRVDIHEVNNGIDIDNEYFDNEEDAYKYAKEQCYGQELQADIYYYADEYGEIENESDFAYADWEWIDCVGFIDGQMNQF